MMVMNLSKYYGCYNSCRVLPKRFNADVEEDTFKQHKYVAHGIGDTALIHFKISMRLLILIEVRPIIYQKLQNFANINNLMLK